MPELWCSTFRREFQSFLGSSVLAEMKLVYDEPLSLLANQFHQAIVLAVVSAASCVFSISIQTATLESEPYSINYTTTLLTVFLQCVR